MREKPRPLALRLTPFDRETYVFAIRAATGRNSADDIAVPMLAAPLKEAILAYP